MAWRKWFFVQNKALNLLGGSMHFCMEDIYQDRFGKHFLSMYRTTDVAGEKKKRTSKLPQLKLNQYFLQKNCFRCLDKRESLMYGINLWTKFYFNSVVPLAEEIQESNRWRYITITQIQLSLTNLFFSLNY